jgi:hypothetical protein
MCQTHVELLEHAEALVIGNTGEEAALVLSEVGHHHQVVDLMRGGIRSRASQQVEA